MSTRLLIAGLAATSMTVPAAAQTALPAQANVAVMQNAQSAVYSVRTVQEALNRLGYDAGPADGIMGSRTQRAIMAYQRDEGLPQTGQADAELYARMLGASAGDTTASAPTTDTTQAGAPTSAAVTSGQTVVDVQTELRRRGYGIDVITGTWDVPTRDAVLAYQRDAGMPQTGIIDESLAAALNASVVADRRVLVRDIQTALASRGYNPGPADGTLSPMTQAAIRTYEADAGLPVTGAASAALLARLEDGSGVATATGESDLVASVQDELIARGYLDGEADGVMDATTSAAIRRFQTDAGLAVTGAADETVLATLRATDVTQSSANRARVVADIEEALRLRRYAVGPVDGVLDPQSEAAIRQFQTDAGMTVDGRPDRELLATIRSSEVVAAPMTPQQAIQGVVEGATTRLLETIVTPGQQNTQ